MFRSPGLLRLLGVLTAFPLIATTGSVSAQVAVSSADGARGVAMGGDESQRNQPYTLKQQTTTLRILADGTHITSVREETRMRDAEGRTRTEITRDSQNALMLKSVQIFDPVARTWTSLDERNKIAHISHISAPKPPTPEQQAQLAEVRARAEAARTASPSSDSAAGDQSSAKIHRQVEVLAARTIAGVAVEGKRITRTIPAGKQGNDRDLTVVTETWTSPELRIILERTTDDPRTGKATTTTTSLERASPDPALFQVPADFQVEDKQPGVL